MIDAIYIPTLGRSDRQITFDNMPDEVKKITFLVIQPKEKKAHSRYPCIVLPEDDIGITQTRKFIWDYGKKQKYFMMDDDVKMACRKPWHDGDKTKRIMTKSDWNYFLNTTSAWMDKGIFWGGCRTGGLPPSGKEYASNTGTAEVFFFDGKNLPDSENLDWDLSTAEDISLNLQLLIKGYQNRVWDRFVYLSDYVGTQGGCADMGRTLDMINDNHDKLVKKFPRYVFYNGTRPLMGGTFNKIKVMYNKSYNQRELNLGEKI